MSSVPPARDSGRRRRGPAAPSASKRGLGDDERAEYERLWAHVEPHKARDILIGSLVAFARRGYHAATTRDIADVVGMSPAGVYVHYRSKEAVLIELITRGHEVILERVQAALADTEDSVSRVRRYAEAWAEGHARLHTLARVAQYELVSVPPEGRAEISRIRAELVALLEEPIARGARAGLFDVPDVTSAGRAVISLGMDVARWYGLERDRPDPSLIGRQYGEYAVRMLSAPAGR